MDVAIRHATCRASVRAVTVSSANRLHRRSRSRLREPPVGRNGFRGWLLPLALPALTREEVNRLSLAARISPSSPRRSLSRVYAAFAELYPEGSWLLDRVHRAPSCSRRTAWRARPPRSRWPAACSASAGRCVPCLDRAVAGGLPRDRDQLPSAPTRSRRAARRRSRTATPPSGSRPMARAWRARPGSTRGRRGAREERKTWRTCRQRKRPTSGRRVGRGRGRPDSSGLKPSGAFAASRRPSSITPGAPCSSFRRAPLLSGATARCCSATTAPRPPSGRSNWQGRPVRATIRAAAERLGVVGRRGPARRRPERNGRRDGARA